MTKNHLSKLKNHENMRKKKLILTKCEFEYELHWYRIEYI